MNKEKNSKNQELENSNKIEVKSMVFIFLTLVVVVGSAFAATSYVIGTNRFIEKITSNFRSEQEIDDKNRESLRAEIERLNSEDTRKTNNALLAKMDDLTELFKVSLGFYKNILDIEGLGGKVEPLQSGFASMVSEIAKGDLLKASSESAKLAKEIEKENNRLKTLVAVIPKNVPEKNEPPSSGYSKQKVKVGENYFVVDIIAADLNSTKVVVDTASDSTCTNDCPVLPLATYAARSGAYAGINGTYFCPDTYPDCASKKNTFDVLVMNKNKNYLNSENNVYSSVPAAIFSGNSARFVRESRSWGRDTGVDSVIANRPLLLIDGNVTVGTTDQNKENLRGNRGFLGSKDSMVYIGIVRGASVGEAALTLKEMGLKNAINLDSGGSTALWNGGYKAGPGRNIPNAVLFVKK